MGYQWVISRLSLGYQWVISGLSDGLNGLNGLNGLLTEGLAVLHYTQCCTSRSFMSSVKRGNVDPNMLAGPES